MDCYNCGSKLGAGQICLKCGAAVSVYKRIMHTANSLYNAGLAKAKVRDLSGAAAVLTQCLELNKRHTDARNLLGLIYYETGETVDAMTEWVISKNFQPEGNEADRYLKLLQQNQARLKSIDTTNRKFNQALELARTGSDDLAVLQLLKVINLNARFVKAYQLLSLLYIHRGEYKKAHTTIRKALEIDKTNDTSLRYMQEIKQNGKREKSEQKKQEKRRESTVMINTTDESIVPSYKPGTGILSAVLYVLGGLALGLAIAWFVIIPSVKHDMNRKFDETLMGYGDKMSSNQAEVSGLTQQVEKLENEKEQLQNQLNGYTDPGGILSTYDALLEVLNAYVKQDFIAAINAYGSVDASKVTSQVFQQVYAGLKEEIETNGFTTLFNTAKAAYDSRDYETARDNFLMCLELNPDDVESKYWLGLSYHNLGDKETAFEYYTDIIDNYPDSPFAEFSRTHRGY
ncbi:tetratricopeptide repeat protein [Lachnotalea sp. AF33-28]|jgi:tetratricopeptide (TPR) repeat protein|uniref:tetratricopeptide repeat protein n=1 Tax=Lachnotalea sp. AF33-28 TaxID=2292046 RepID=UPI0013148A48|nr:tetratricopeptide repeat protein [Lachnotalea sp. AF33-28]